MNDVILKKIVTEVKSAKYFAILADTTTDISHKDQFSLCLRYVNTIGDPLERFISFKSVPDGSATAETMEHMVLKELADIDLSIGDIRGQSFDGASNMSGAYSGLQTRIKQHTLNAFYVWCSNHRLNLVLVDAATSFVEAKSNFGLLQRLYTFFSASHKRYAVYESTMDEQKTSKTLYLKRLSETRWSARYDAVNTIRVTLPVVIESLEKLSSDTSISPAVYSEIQGILANVSSFKFLLQTCIWHNILSITKGLSDYLQSPTSLIKGTERSLEAKREKFEEFFRHGQLS